MNILINLTIFILGASIGSFLNVLIDRLPKEESIIGRSHCDFCGKKLRWLDLFPILSFLFLKGKSHCCHKKLSFQYPLVELITGFSFLLVYLFVVQANDSFIILSLTLLKLVGMWGIISSLIVIFLSDFKYHLISDYLLISFTFFSFLLHLIAGNTIDQWIVNIFSGLIVGLPIYLIYKISREKAMGLGDVYLSTITGFLLGWKSGFIALYIAFVTGAIYGLILIIFQKKKIKSKIAFGPFIVIGIILMLFFSNNIFSIIKSIYGY